MYNLHIYIYIKTHYTTLKLAINHYPNLTDKLHLYCNIAKYLLYETQYSLWLSVIYSNKCFTIITLTIPYKYLLLSFSYSMQPRICCDFTQNFPQHVGLRINSRLVGLESTGMSNILFTFPVWQNTHTHTRVCTHTPTTHTHFCLCVLSLCACVYTK